MSPDALEPDTKALNTVYTLAVKAKEKTAALAAAKSAPALTHARETERRAIAAVQRRTGIAKSAKNKLQKLQQVKAAPTDIAKAKAELATEERNLSADQETLATAAQTLSEEEQPLASMETQVALAHEDLKTAIDSPKFDFKAMSVTDLAKLSLVLVDNPLAKPKSAGQIANAVAERFDNPDLGTVSAIAKASLDKSAGRALANAITSMKPEPWAALFMEVQGQGKRPGEAEDPFVQKLFEKIGEIDLESMKFLNDRLDSMTPSGRDTYVKQLEAGIVKSVVATGSQHLDDDAFERCSAKLTAHADAWSSLQSAKPEGERTPYLANLTTTEFTKLFEAFQKDARWSNSEGGRTLVADFSTRFHSRLMSTSSETAKEELGAIAIAAISTSYVAKLTTPQIGRLFELLQKNAGAWRSPALATFTAQVNARFLHDYLKSVTSETAQDERDWLSSAFADVGNRWKASVAEQVGQPGVDQAHAEAHTPFGTLNSDDVATLFVESQRLAGLLTARADASVNAVDTKFAACYPQIDLKTHQMLISSYPSMSRKGRLTFAAAANRPPEQLSALLEQVFKQMKSQMRPEIGSASAIVLTGFRAVTEYRRGLPGSTGSPKEMFEWLRQALPVVEATQTVAQFANSPGAFRDAWLAPKGAMDNYLHAAAHAAQALDAPEWHKFTAMVSVSRFFADEDTAWTPALQKHFESLFKLKTGGPQENVCRYHLEALKTYQAIKDANGISQRGAMKMLKALEKMAPPGAGNFLTTFRVELNLLARHPDSERRDNILSKFRPALMSAHEELLREGVKSYMASNPLALAN